MAIDSYTIDSTIEYRAILRETNKSKRSCIDVAGTRLIGLNGRFGEIRRNGQGEKMRTAING